MVPTSRNADLPSDIPSEWLGLTKASEMKIEVESDFQHDSSPRESNEGALVVEVAPEEMRKSSSRLPAAAASSLAVLDASATSLSMKRTLLNKTEDPTVIPPPAESADADSTDLHDRADMRDFVTQEQRKGRLPTASIEEPATARSEGISDIVEIADCDFEEFEEITQTETELRSRFVPALEETPGPATALMGPTGTLALSHDVIAAAAQMAETLPGLSDAAHIPLPPNTAPILPVANLPSADYGRGSTPPTAWANVSVPPGPRASITSSPAFAPRKQFVPVVIALAAAAMLVFVVGGGALGFFAYRTYFSSPVVSGPRVASPIVEAPSPTLEPAAGVAPSTPSAPPVLQPPSGPNPNEAAISVDSLPSAKSGRKVPAREPAREKVRPPPPFTPTPNLAPYPGRR